MEEKKAADARIQELKNERFKAEQAMEQLRKQFTASKKEQESKMFKIQEENDALNHDFVVLKMEKKEALEKVASLDQEIKQAEAAIGDAKNALQKLLVDKEEASRRIESLEEDFGHAQATIDAMTKSMSQAREEYEAKIDSLMAGLTTAREVHASRSMAGSQSEQSRSLALTRTETRSSAYSIPEPRSYARGKDSAFNGSYNSNTLSGGKSTIDENKPYSSSRSRRTAGVQSTYSANNTLGEETLGRKKELAVDIDNMTIASELTDLDSGSKIDRSSASSTLRDLSRFSRARSAGRARALEDGRARSTGRRQRSFHEGDKDAATAGSKSVATPPKSADAKLSNLDLARTFLSSESNGETRAASRARSRSRSRLPQDRDAFDDSKSVGAQSFGGASIYNDAKSRSKSKGFGGNYDGDLNGRGERHGYGAFVADNGNEYEGEWKNDKREGHGKAKYNTGDVYIGNWKNCKRHGHGTMYIENGDVYEGGWNNGFKDGPGTYRWRDGEVDISRYSSDYRVEEGVRWSEDRQRVFRLVRGNVQEEVDLGEADRIAHSLGLPQP